MEEWKQIHDFPDYSVSTLGRVRNDKFDRILAQIKNQSGTMFVGLYSSGISFKRSVALLVAKAFIPHPMGPFDTPINLDGDRYNNEVENLAWRPRWFAVKYHRQFAKPNRNHILEPIVDIKSDLVSENSIECAKQYGILETDVILSILNNTFVWPTYQRFRVVNNGYWVTT